MIRDKCLALLARREYSQLELKQRLLAKGYEKDSILDTIAVLVREGLQSDQRFSESYVRYRSGYGMGPLKIRAELMQKGVEASLIHNALSQIDWYALCAALVQRRFGEDEAVGDDELITIQSTNESHPVYNKNTAYKNKSSLVRFLNQRGFSAEHINKAIRNKGKL